MNDEIITKALDFWERLSDAEKALILNNTKEITYEQGQIIHSADQNCIGVVIVKSGGLRTYILSEDGREITLYRLGEKEVCILSASCLLKNITFDVYIEAESDSKVLLLSAPVFSQLQSTNVYVENFALKLAADRFSDVMWAMQQILFYSVDRRLSAFLIDESVKNKTDHIQLTHEQIAKYMGSAREVVSKMLKNFERDGIVKLQRGGVLIMDKQKLRELL